jgi:hypothetical protein
MQRHRRRCLLFLQLPQPDNAVGRPHENTRLAAVCLAAALRRSPERRQWRVIPAPPHVDTLDDRHTTDWIVRRQPDAIAVTLYLWNVERTLDVLKRVRSLLPRVRVVAGGPEVAADHPFLLRDRAVDAVVSGEGEHVFSAILRSFRTGHRPALPGVAWRVGNRVTPMLPAVAAGKLQTILPRPTAPGNRPDADGMGYIEAGRGCPLRCTFCRYSRRPRSTTWLDAGDVIRRVTVLAGRGATSIRFVDPTFNANPEFDAIVRRLAAFNRGRRIRFFAELRAETIAPRQAALLAAANVREVEVGVQSRDPAALRAVRRPTNLRRLDAGIALLARAGIRLTVDVMAGLPGQTLRDIRASLRWAAHIPRANVQFLHALLLPGTALRAEASGRGFAAQARPPYRVVGTPTLSADDFVKAERFARRLTGTVPDSPTRRFVGRRLPDLFPERVVLSMDVGFGAPLTGRQIRRALILRGDDLFAVRSRLLAIVRRAVRDEPHVQWQFVLAPAAEEPLDILDDLIDAIDSGPSHLLDRLVFPVDAGPRAARRVFILLRGGRRYDPDWVAAAECALRSAFF